MGPGEPAAEDVRYFDGESSARHEVALRFSQALEIRRGEAMLAAWPYSSIRRMDGGTGVMRLKSLAAPELARLDIRDETTKALLEAGCPLLDDQQLRRHDLIRIVLWSLAAACSIVLLAIFGVPLLANRIAPLVPPSLEAHLGEAAAKEVAVVFGDKVCNSAEGHAALNDLAVKLAGAGGLKVPLTVTVLHSKTPNAFALPGGGVYVLSALIDKAADPDELGGVLAHELGHVAHRDGLRLMISNGGTAFLFSLLMGDVTGAGAVIFTSKTLVTSANTREAEANADAFAATVLHRLGRSSAPLGTFLVRLTGQQNLGALSLLQSHPLSQERLEALKRDDVAETGLPLVDSASWRAIKAMCASTNTQRPSIAFQYSPTQWSTCLRAAK